MTEIKICGIKNQRDVEILNETQVSYAGFVLFEKSRRCVTAAEAEKLFKTLSPGIKKAAVTVSPDLCLLAQIEKAGFDILQVHGELREDVLKNCRIPIWRAVNLSDGAPLQASALEELLSGQFLPDGKCSRKIQAVLVDAKEYGSGKTFDWEAFFGRNGEYYQEFRSTLKNNRIKFVLAGGLNPENAAEGIRMFEPDAVDVSSGVEGAEGKDRALVQAFVREVKKTDVRDSRG